MQIKKQSTMSKPRKRKSGPRNRNKYMLGGRSFATKDEIKKHCQDLLHDSESVRSFERGSPEFAFLFDLLQRHYRSDEKVGVGVESFGIKSMMGSRCFEVWRTDSTCEVFSYHKCISAPNVNVERTKAFREEVKEQTYHFRSEALAAEDPRCAITGRTVTNETADVDHIVEFQQLLGDFLREEQLELADIKVDRTAENRPTVADRRIALLWKEYHRQHAQLRLLHRETHAEHTLKRWKREKTNDQKKARRLLV